MRGGGAVVEGSAGSSSVARHHAIDICDLAPVVEEALHEIGTQSVFEIAAELIGELLKAGTTCRFVARAAARQNIERTNGHSRAYNRRSARAIHLDHIESQ